MTDGWTFGRLRDLRSRARFGKFVSVGVIGALCDTAVFVTLAEGFGVVPELATLVGIETAILIMFAINDRWTFAEEGDAGKRSLLGRLKRSHVVRAGGSMTQFVVFVLVYRVLFVPLVLGDVAAWNTVASTIGLGAGGLTDFDLWLVVAKGCGIGVGMMVNYVFESLFTWRVGAEV